MVYRYSWIAGIGAIALAFWELSSLLRDSESGTPWQVAILVATLLGAGITWTAIAYRANAFVILVANVAMFILTAGLLVAPETLWIIFPTRETFIVIGEALERALEIIRYGVEPVRPLPGLILLIAGLFWTLGFLLVAGLLNRRPFVAILTPLIVALQFVIIDRRPKPLIHLGIFVGVVALSLLAIRVDERDSGAGRLQRVNGSDRPRKRPSPAITVLVATTVAVSLVAVGVIGDRVPSDGIVPWRSPAGFSDNYSGSVTYNPFTDIRIGLRNQTKNPLFQAEIEGVDPGSVRFRTVTLDHYRNGRWITDRVQIYRLDDEPWIEPTQAYRGETDAVRATILIQNLRQPWMPAPATPTNAAAADDDDTGAMRVRRLDGSLYIPGDATYPNMEYAVTSTVPRYDGPTIAALALTETGSLSPLFATAADNGESISIEDAATMEPAVLEDEEFWLQYPEEDLGVRFRLLSEDVIGNVETNFEKALALENWFRDSGDFIYNDAVPGEFATDDPFEWLADPDGRLGTWARTGYCEQFATAMALMARTVGVPSRVVLGFTPGDVLNDSRVQVTDKNAHAWVELWIPEYGWMEFDPTPRSLYSAPTANDSLAEALGFSPADYLDEIPDSTNLVDTEGGQSGPDGPLGSERNPPTPSPVLGGSGSDSTGGPDLPSWFPFAIGVAVVLLVGLVAAPVMQWWRRRRFMKRLERGDVSAAWQDIVERLVDLNEPVDPAATPLEAATQIDDAFVPLARTYGQALYGDSHSTAVVDHAVDAHDRADRHLTTRYSRTERIRAMYRPTKLTRRWKSIVARFRPRR